MRAGRAAVTVEGLCPDPPRVVIVAMTQEIEKIGSVGFDRYTEIVTELRKLVETIGQAQFAVGDYALEIEPMHAFRQPEPGEEMFTVRDSLLRLSEDIGLSYSVVKNAR